ncbi:MAG: helix-turn-helix domain-containing protein [Erythrobacter sp.]
MDSEQDSTLEELAELLESESASVGDRLRSAREARRLNLDHIAAETRIPVRHLESIEAGSFDNLPSRTYAIGFARNYAKAVGLDEKSITDAVREELADGQARASAMAGGMEPGDPAKLPSAGLAWFGGFAAIVLAIGLISFFTSYFSAGGELPSLIAEETSEPTNEVAAATELASAGGESVVATSGGPVVFTALEDGIWVRFYEDGGERLFEAQMSQGDRFELPLDAVEPRINTGRPDAFAITIGGREVPKLSDEPETIGDTPVSAAALLARADTPVGAPSNN